MSEQQKPTVQRVFDLGALQHALQIAKKDSVTDVLERFNKCLGQLLWVAVKTGNSSCVQELIRAGADPNCAELSFHGEAEVGFQVFAAQTYFQMGYPVPSQTDLLSLLSEQVYDCEICNAENSSDSIEQLVFKHDICTVWCPLVLAIRNNNLLAAKILIEKGALLTRDCGVWDEYLHVNPIEIAIIENREHILLACINQGVDVNTCIRSKILLNCKSECLKILLQARLHTSPLNWDNPLAIAAGLSGPKVPEEQVEPLPYSLKFIARGVIRQQLLQSNPVNLFVIATPKHLALPKSLCRYILCEFELA